MHLKQIKERRNNWFCIEYFISLAGWAAAKYITHEHKWFSWNNIFLDRLKQASAYFVAFSLVLFHNREKNCLIRCQFYSKFTWTQSINQSIIHFHTHHSSVWLINQLHWYARILMKRIECLLIFFFLFFMFVFYCVVSFSTIRYILCKWYTACMYKEEKNDEIEKQRKFTISHTVYIHSIAFNVVYTQIKIILIISERHKLRTKPNQQIAFTV